MLFTGPGKLENRSMKPGSFPGSVLIFAKFIIVSVHGLAIVVRKNKKYGALNHNWWATNFGHLSMDAQLAQLSLDGTE